MLTAPREIELHGHDGWRLNVLDLVPAAPPVAMAIVGNAMLANRRTLWRGDRPSLCAELLQANIRVLVPELRGRGKSGPTPREGATWRYSDLIADVGTYLALARSLTALPVFLVGHSLFGHAALAYLGMHPEAQVAGMVALGVHIWNRRFEANPLRWWLMRLFVAVGAYMIKRRGYMPVLSLGAGSAEESGGYFWDMVRWIKGNTWSSPDGVDYWENLSKVSCPVLHVLSRGDTWYGRPDAAYRFSAPLPRREIICTGDSIHPAYVWLRPNHMELVTSWSCRPLWQDIARWVATTAAADSTTVPQAAAT